MTVTAMMKMMMTTTTTMNYQRFNPTVLLQTKMQIRGCGPLSPVLLCLSFPFRLCELIRCPYIRPYPKPSNPNNPNPELRSLTIKT